MFLGLLDPDLNPLFRRCGSNPDPSINMLKMVRKTWIPVLSLKNDVNLPSKGNKQKNLS
jgi:hypothetical protein